MTIKHGQGETITRPRRVAPLNYRVVILRTVADLRGETQQPTACNTITYRHARAYIHAAAASLLRTTIVAVFFCTAIPSRRGNTRSGWERGVNP